MKKISIADSEFIRRHQTNNSSSKTAFKFSKSKRFPNPNPECPLVSYNHDSSLSHRKTSFGFGNRSNFNKDFSCSPPSSKYKIKSSFQLSPSKGKSFGLSRELLPDKSYLVPQMHRVPGPGNYDLRVQSKKNLSCTLHPKTNDYIEKKLSFKQSPGPAAYEVLDMSPKSGRFKISKFADFRLAKINPKSEKAVESKDSPGPCSYHIMDNFSPRGNYVLSKNRGSGGRVFNRTARSTFTDDFRKTGLKFPGPGEYERPSQFGQYGDVEYYKTREGSSTIE